MVKRLWETISDNLFLQFRYFSWENDNKVKNYKSNKDIVCVCMCGIIIQQIHKLVFLFYALK